MYTGEGSEGTHHANVGNDRQQLRRLWRKNSNSVRLSMRVSRSASQCADTANDDRAGRIAPTMRYLAAVRQRNHSIALRQLHTSHNSSERDQV
jgi:hypothetical protein